MPLYEYQCEDCGKTFEKLITASDAAPNCNHCGSTRLNKLVSAHSSMSGVGKNRMPGPGDTSCCGASPGQANCAGPGSCCGRGPA